MKPTNANLFHVNRGLLKKKDPSLEVLLALTPFTYPSLTSREKEELKKYYFELSKQQTNRLFLFQAYPLEEMEVLLHWLNEKENRDLIFLENELHFLKHFVASPIARPFLNHQRVHLFWSGSTHFWESNQKKLEYFLSQPFHISTPPLNNSDRAQGFEEIKQRLYHLSIDLNVYCSEYLNSAPLVYHNFLKNLLELDGSKTILSLKGAFKETPALICAAGPSLNPLNKQIEALKKKCLLFAGGRALSVLSDLKIEPHFALGIDPFEQHTQTLRCNQFFEIPLFYRLRAHHQAIAHWQGPKIYVPKAIGYSFVDWFERELGLDMPTLEEGLNVVNFNIEIAAYLGCNPIILAGCDLAYQQKQAYSPSIPDEQILPDFNCIEEKDLSLNRGFFRPGNHGEPLFTLWKWIEEAKWISNFAQKHPQIKIYNTSLEGLKIEHVEVISIDQLLQQSFFKRIDFENTLHSLMMHADDIQVSKPQICQILNRLIKSLEALKPLFESLNQQSLNDLDVSFLEEQIETEIAYEHLLKPYEELFLRLDPKNLKESQRQRKCCLLESKRKEFYALFKNFNQVNS